ncbi:two-component system regulatory protein YycI [Ruminiclostridium herbifermentans]|uniref:Two-component system regulatory protein YycI n=1 Tax=Ruminiclostridium herbifermentans TaxID=2488810 RepID=A0A4U7J9Y5_9FIRM|nr:two-component system regulatory protein YycI [Ruminiclostridium herbifermentans]QNU66788.1 two-component system regulatory protein YycI [Ruminiclostridium herbifermentans]
MDWKRAKSILITVFILLNIVLAITLYNELKIDDISQQTIINTQKILMQNNIHIECPIPKYTGNDYTLKYEEKALDEKQKAAILQILLGNNYIKEGINLYKKDSKNLEFYEGSGFLFSDTGSGPVVNGDDLKGNVDKYLKDLFEKIGLPFNEFKHDGYYADIKNEENVKITYKGQYKEYPVFDNYIDVEVSNLRIKSIKYHYRKPTSITIKKDVFVIPSFEILITEMTKYPGIDIIQVDMGFKGYTKNDKKTKTSYEGLAWRIKTTNGDEYYFNARNGTLIG